MSGRRALSRLGIAAAALLAMAAIVAVPLRLRRDARTPIATSAAAMPLPSRSPGDPSDAMAHESEVFRMRPEMLASGSDAERRSAAHPRTLATYRQLRAYPGAPPRIPHGLTREELRTGACTTCHERGGYSPRFGAYAPVTPHAELLDCLQCHLADAAVAGVELPRRGADATCRQCHAPGRVQPTQPGWRGAPWPALAGPADGTPPPVPHDLADRGRCIACHAGPGAVAEIRTDHPELSDCRACHVSAGGGAS